MMTRRVSSWLPGYRKEITKRQYAAAIELKSVYRIELAKHNRTWKDDKGKPLKLWCAELELLPSGDDYDESSDESGEAVAAKRTRKRNHPDHVWLETAKKVIAENIDPHQFVRMQFIAMNLEGHRAGSPPAPNSLNTPRAVDNYRSALDATKHEIEVGWSFQLSEFHRRTACSMEDGKDAWIPILYDNSTQLSALFRYCTAYDVASTSDDDDVRRVFGRICSEYRGEAAEQYLDHPDAYDAVWGVNHIPNKFRKQADLIYQARYGKQVTA